ncbi:hypothetical protein BJ508DRAFT_311712 [Ascobolus immersus RN42]|uniref:Uncharacterized protein n=1 Tax=Ascobolus immersus RN42 TaxID=1160509 RepID=A0A3N4HPQ6_ASCIM|nr:hypothetical protein BJ508DRAFT_311712 [Ascobolus immersus RN42]
MRWRLKISGAPGRSPRCRNCISPGRITPSQSVNSPHYAHGRRSLEFRLFGSCLPAEESEAVIWEFASLAPYRPFMVTLSVASQWQRVSHTHFARAMETIDLALVGPRGFDNPAPMNEWGILGLVPSGTIMLGFDQSLSVVLNMKLHNLASGMEGPTRIASYGGPSSSGSPFILPPTGRLTSAHMQLPTSKPI